MKKFIELMEDVAKEIKYRIWCVRHSEHKKRNRIILIILLIIGAYYITHKDYIAFEHEFKEHLTSHDHEALREDALKCINDGYVIRVVKDPYKYQTIFQYNSSKEDYSADDIKDLDAFLDNYEATRVCTRVFPDEDNVILFEKREDIVGIDTY